MNKTKLIALLILISSTASAYVIKETKSNEDFKVFVAPGGTPSEALKIGGLVTEGTSIRNQQGSTLTLRKTGGGAGLSFWPGDVGTSNVVSLENNAGSFLFYNHSAQLNGAVTQAGAWTLGATGGTQVHTVNGQLRVVHTGIRHSVDSPGGLGSTNTFVAYFSAVRDNNLGSDISYSNSGALGDSWTINTSGFYSMTAGISVNANFVMGITLDSTANPATINWANLLCYDEPAANFAGSCSVTTYLVAGSVIRVNVNTGTIFNGARTGFRIARLF